MTRSSILATAVLAFLLLTSGAILIGSTVADADDYSEKQQWNDFLVSEGKNYDPTGGDTDWTPISTYEELQSISDMNGKYYLTNDINMTSIFAEDDFNVIIGLDINENKVTVSLGIKTFGSSINHVPMYVGYGGTVTLNGQSQGLGNDEYLATATFEFDAIPTEFQLFAKGTVMNLDDTYENTSFVISASGTAGAINGKVVPAKGNFNPIGSYSHPFTGIFDGNGHVIYGLRIASLQTSGNIGLGLFAATNGATIKNLGLELGSSVGMLSTYSSNSVYAGSLIGYADGTTNIINTYSTGQISVQSSATTAYVGGLVGYSNGVLNINSSYNAGTVSVAFLYSSSSSYYTFVGGLVGYAREVTGLSGTYNSGNISSFMPSISTASNERVGGLIGYTNNNLSLNNTYNVGSITASSTSTLRVGGLVGEKYSNESAKIINSYNAGSITATSPSKNVGGLIGSLSTATGVYGSFVISGIGIDNMVGSGTAITYDELSGFKEPSEITGRSSFTNWNFNSLWVIDANVNNGYPYLGQGMGSTERWVNFMVNEGENYDPTNGEDDWIPVSTVAELQSMKDSNKYYLANDIDLSYIKPIGAFDVKIQAVVNNGSLTISLYNNDTTTDLLFSGKMSVNGVLKNIASTDANGWTFTIPSGTTELMISAAGTASHAPTGADALFMIVTVIPVSGNGTYTDVISSKGNFTPIASSDSFRGIFDGNGYVIKGAKTVATGTSRLYSGLFHTASPNAIIRNVGLEGGSSMVYSPSGSTSNYIWAGGLVSYSNGPLEITNSYNMNCVSVLSATLNITIGGIGGQLGDVILKDSYNTGPVSGMVERIDSSATVGGLVGSATDSTITKSYNTGSVWSSAPFNTTTGGLIASTINSTITDSYNVGSVSTGNPSNLLYIGGLIGSTRGSTTTISNSYNTGPISYLVSSSGKGIGGLIGSTGYPSSNPTVVSSYALTNVVTTRLVGDFSSFPADGLSGFKSSDELKDPSTYVNWEFGAVWEIDSGKNNGYPYFKEKFNIVRWTNFIVDEGSEYDPTNGEEGWIPISTVDDLQNISSSGKYYLTNNIDMTYVNAPGSFVITLNAEVVANMVTVSLFHSDTVPMTFSGILSVNGTVKTISSTNSESFTIEAGTTELIIAAGGNAGSVPSGADSWFAIGTEITLTAESTYNETLQSKGNFDPIGSASSRFVGTLDGNGYVISGLRVAIYQAPIGTVHAGLFSYAGNGAAIKNLGLEGGSSIAVSPETVSAGGLIANSVIVSIINSYNTGMVAAVSSSQSVYSGGLLGMVNNVDMLDSYHTGSVSATLYDSTDNITYVGGLVGYASNRSMISGSYNEGKVKVLSSLSAPANMSVGGLIGSSEMLTLIDSYNVGSASVESDSSSDTISVGGLIGLSNSNNTAITNSYNVGPIDGASADRAGALVGYAGIGEITLNSSYALSTVGADKLVGNESSSQYDGLSSFKDATAMRERSTFVHWDFAMQWAIENGYPHFGTGTDRIIVIYCGDNGKVEISVGGETEEVTGSPDYASFAHGTSFTLSAIADTGYSIQWVFINGVSYATVDNLRFDTSSQVTSDMIIFAVFKPILYNVEVNLTDTVNASVDMSAAAVNIGKGFAFEVTTDEGYYIGELQYNTSVATVERDENVITASEVQGHCSISVAISGVKYNVTLASATGIDPKIDDVEVSHNGTATLTYDLDPAYVVSSAVFSGDGTVNWSVIGTITVTNVTSGGVVTVTTAKTNFVLTVNAGDGGEVSVNGATANSGTFVVPVPMSSPYVILEATGYDDNVFVEWTGGISGRTNPIEAAITGDTTVNAVFADNTDKDYFILTVNAGDDGNVAFNNETALEGTFEVAVSKTSPDIVLTATGYESKVLVEWTGDITGKLNPLKATMTGDAVVNAIFDDNMSSEYYLLKINAGSNGKVAFNTEPAQDGTFEVAVPNGLADIVLTATGIGSYILTEWAGDISERMNPLSTTLEGDTEIEAVFENNSSGAYYMLKVNAGSGGKVSFNGGIAQLGTFEVAVSKNSADIMLTAFGIGDNVLVEWTGDIPGKLNPLKATMTDDAEVTAVFGDNSSVDYYILTVNAGPNGEVAFGDEPAQDGTFEVAVLSTSADITLTATGIGSYVFTEWTGGISGKTNPLKATMTGDVVVTASFLERTSSGYYILTVNAGDDGEVSVNGEAALSGTFDIAIPADSSRAVLEAIGYNNFILVEWTGVISGNTNPMTITLTEDTMITAVFEDNTNLEYYILTVNAGNDGMVAVNEGPAQSGAFVVAIPKDDADVLLKATGFEDNVFIEWTDDIAGDTNPLMTTIERDTGVTAVFADNASGVYYVVSAVINGDGAVFAQSGGIEQSITKMYEDEATFELILESGYLIHFVHLDEDESELTSWEDNIVRLSTVTDDCVLTITVGNVNTHEVVAIIDGVGGEVISLNPAIVDHGMDAGFVVHLEDGYEIKSVTTEAPFRVARLPDNIVTVSQVTEDCEIIITVGKIKQDTGHDVTITSSDGGKTSPSGTRSVSHGASITITFTPDPGYWLTSVKVNGINNSDAVDAGKITLTIIMDTTVEAIFDISEDDEMVHLEVIAGEGGDAYGSGTYMGGTTVTISAEPWDGYRFVEWSDGDTSQERKILVFEDMTITAYFEESSGGSSLLSSNNWWWILLLIIIIFTVTAILVNERMKRM